MGLLRTVEYEDEYLKAYDSVGGARLDLARYFEVFNTRRPPQVTDIRRTWSTSKGWRRWQTSHEWLA